MLRNVRAPRCLIDDPPAAALAPYGDGDMVDLDIAIKARRIDQITPRGSLAATRGPDLDAAPVLPGLLDVHTHLDKAHVWPRQPNPTCDVAGAQRATVLDCSAHWNMWDMQLDFALGTAYARGGVAIRTHRDSLGSHPEISFPVFRAMRDRWAGRIELQVSIIVTLDTFLGEAGTPRRPPKLPH